MNRGKSPIAKLFMPAVLLTTLLIVSLSVFTVYQFGTLADYADRIYNHPLPVSNAVREVRETITAMHRTMKDAVIAETPEALAREVEAVDRLEKKALRAFELIELRFLGDKSAVAAARKDFLDWRPIRDRVIALKQQGRTAEAAAVTRGKGAGHIERICRGADGTAGLDGLLAFANSKALEFRQAAFQRKKAARMEIDFILAGVILLSFITLLLFRRGVRTTLALAFEKEQLLVTLQAIGDGVLVADTAGAVRLLNPAAEFMTGWPLAEAQGRPVSEVFKIVNEHSREPLESPVEKVLQLNRGIGLANDTILIARDGTEKVVADSGAPIHDSDGRVQGVVLVFRDETKKTETERQLRQSQKMEAIGTLAGGIAHDFNNILGGIIGYTELAQDEIPADSPAQEFLQGVLTSSARARDLVRQILTFSRKGQETRKPVDISPIVKEAAKLLRSTLPATIEIKQSIDGQAGLVSANPVQIHQILMNLGTNAAQAMREGGGVLEITLSRVSVTRESPGNFQALSPGPFVELKVSDTGAGIDSKIIHRIFEPFFTTSKTGKGTGMGLAMVHGIVREHGGDISVESRPGQGSTFTILLPREIAGPGREQDLTAPAPAGSERILFVDDEKTLMDIGRKLLEGLGYSVTAVGSSLEALEIFEQTPDRFDLVITDQTMPHMTGFLLARRLLEIRPGLPVILCTGYSDSVTPEAAEAAGIKSIFFKPISKKELADKIREVLK